MQTILKENRVEGGAPDSQVPILVMQTGYHIAWKISYASREEYFLKIFALAGLKSEK